MLVTGAGPIGMLAAMIGVQHGLDVHVLDRVTDGAKPQLVHDVGATYHSGAIADIGFDPDVIIECTGVGSVIIDSIRDGRRRRSRLPHGRRQGWAAQRTPTGRRGQGAGPAQQRGLRLGQRQPPALLPRGRRARRRRPGLARTAHHAPGAASEHRRRAQAEPRTTSRSSWTSEADDGDQEPEQDGGAVACSTKQTQLGEGVRWDARRGEMLGVDILAGRVARGRILADGSLELTHVYELPSTVGMIAPVEGDDGWLLGAGRGFVYLAPTAPIGPSPRFHRRAPG